MSTPDLGRRGSNNARFNQFGGLTGDIEGGLQHRQAKQRRRAGAVPTRNVIALRVVVTLVSLLLVYIWIVAVYKVVFSDGGKTIYNKVVKQSFGSDVGDPSVFPKGGRATAKTPAKVPPITRTQDSKDQKTEKIKQIEVIETSQKPTEKQVVENIVKETPGVGGTEASSEGGRKPLSKRLRLSMDYAMSAPDTTERIRRLHTIGDRDAEDLVLILEDGDPLGVYEYDAEFTCPAERYGIPNYVNTTAAAQFREGGGFIYFQHLRKAGGTAFCDLARRNMKPKDVPRYYCMPDLRGGLATPPWNDRDFFMKSMAKGQWRIAANEWDAMVKSHLQYPGAVFATTMRHPIDRWYSHYRFEHVENRDGYQKGLVPFGTWYNIQGPRTLGHNYYTKTFVGTDNPPLEELDKILDDKGEIRHHKDLMWTYRKFREWKTGVSWEDMQHAMDTLLHFHIILILDLLDKAPPLIEEVLGWKQPPKQVLPHEKMAKARSDKKSPRSRATLQVRDWLTCAKANAPDLLLYHWARRIFLERLTCDDR